MTTHNELITLLNIAEDATGSDFMNDYDFAELIDLYNELKDKLEESNDVWLDLPTGEVRIIHKNIIDELWTESLIDQIKECYDLDNIPSFVEIDWEATAENCKIDGLGHHFGGYDGNEYDSYNYYLFRTN